MRYPLQELAQKLAMQVVGATPKYLDRSAVPAEALEAESRVLREQALKSGGCPWRARPPAVACQLCVRCSI